MDFAALPPEVNSARMYTGPGSGPMLAAATAWDGLASDLSRTASDYGSLIMDMISGPWRGPASAAMAAAATPYASWLGATAAQAAVAATQAEAAAAAYETAFAMTVPPPAIAANRAQLAALVATNLLGQNTPAIAATEAQYAEMWAQDAAAMYGYAGSSATASALASFTAPPQTTGDGAPALAPAGAGAPQAQTALSQVMASVPTALQGLAAPGLGATTPATALGEMENWLGVGGVDLTSPAGVLSFLAGTDGSPLGLFINDNGLNTLFSSGFYMPGNFLGTMTDFVGIGGAGGAAADAADAAAASGLGGSVGGAGGLGGLSGLGGAVSAGVGNAASIGPLSVPPAWTATGPLKAAASALPGPGLGLPPAGASGPASMLGGMPLSAPSGRGFAAQLPRYGSTPTVMPRVPAVG